MTKAELEAKHWRAWMRWHALNWRQFGHHHTPDQREDWRYAAKYREMRRLAGCPPGKEELNALAMAVRCRRRSHGQPAFQTYDRT